jgi:hypothetical protein
VLLGVIIGAASGRGERLCGRGSGVVLVISVEPGEAYLGVAVTAVVCGSWRVAGS